jgi:hypothetical protein
MSKIGCLNNNQPYNLRRTLKGRRLGRLGRYNKEEKHRSMKHNA